MRRSQGFLKATGLASLEEAKIQRDPKKGDFYIALIEKPGRATLDVLADMLPVIVRTFPWPKSMRWGERSARPGALQWVRPLHCDRRDLRHRNRRARRGEVRDRRHRGRPDHLRPSLHGAGGDFGAPLRGLRGEAEGRQGRARSAGAARTSFSPTPRQLAFAQGFELVEDQALLDEVAGLVEWPVVLMGSFDKEFLSIPAR